MLKVLCVEDVCLFVLEICIKRIPGFEFVGCSSIKEALEKIGGCDIAIVDYMLPDGRGSTVLHRCTELDLPACVFTNHYDEHETMADISGTGTFPVLAKPVKEPQLQAMVQRLAGQAEQRNKARERDKLARLLNAGVAMAGASILIGKGYGGGGLSYGDKQLEKRTPVVSIDLRNSVKKIRD